MFDLKKIIGLSVIAIKGFADKDGRIKTVEPKFILFSDGKTYINLEEQDPCSYHDCAWSARLIETREADIEYWAVLLTYPDANSDI